MFGTGDESNWFKDGVCVGSYVGTIDGPSLGIADGISEVGF